MRKIPPTRQSLSGKMASRHLPGKVAFESLLERDFLYLLEANGHLRAVKTQPRTIQLKVNGKKRPYTPDVEVEWREGVDLPFGVSRAIFEVKPFEVLRAKYDELAPKLRAARAYFEEEGIAFKVVTDRYIRGPLLEPARLVVEGLRAGEPSRDAGLAVRKAISDAGGTITLKALKDALTPAFEWPRQRDNAIWFWIGCGCLQAADPLTICDDTPLQWWTS